MPFLGRDWRSPGEQWVRTGEGWQRLDLWRVKLLENLFEYVYERLQLKLAMGEDSYLVLHKELRPSQPYVFVKEVTKEQKVRTAVAEALIRLDMSGAVRDVRRFNYVSKLMLFLIQHKISYLSGMAQKLVLNILEHIVQQAVKTHHNLRTVNQLVNEMQLALARGHYDHVGSAPLWESHVSHVLKLREVLDAVSIQERDNDGKIMFADLPDSIIFEILACLSDHKDLVNAGRTDLRAFELSEQKMLWKNLCIFHFSQNQWNSVLRKGENLESVEWKVLYLRLVKRYGLKDVYAEMLFICRHCNALFWELHGHPCAVPNMKPQSTPVSPKIFVDFFSA